MDQKTKVRENRARRALERQWPGYRLEKTRRRDPHAADYGTFRVVNAEGQTPWQFQSRSKLSLYAIEDRLHIWYEEEDT